MGEIWGRYRGDRSQDRARLLGQTVCGFDLLRSNGVSYCCDVNGFSFVKDSERFWSDSAGLLRQYCLEVTLTLTLTLSLTLTLTLILSLILTLP